MKCEHKRIKSVNCELICMDCVEALPNDFLTVKKGTKNHGQGAKADQTTPEKKTAKTAK